MEVELQVLVVYVGVVGCAMCTKTKSPTPPILYFSKENWGCGNVGHGLTDCRTHKAYLAIKKVHTLHYKRQTT